MKTTLGTFISSISILIAQPVMAQNMDNYYDDETSIVEPFIMAQADETGMDKIKEGISDVATSTKEAIKETYESIKTTFVDDDKEHTFISLNPNMSVNGIMGKPIVNNTGKVLGTVEDIILLDKDGKADMVIISHGGYFKIGSENAAFDYDLVMRRESDGDIIMPLSEEIIKKAKPFSYDSNNTNEKNSVISSKGLSVKSLFTGTLLDNESKKVAKVDNIYLNKGIISYVVFVYDTTLGMGGKKVIIKFSELKLLKSEQGYQFHMNAIQSKRFDYIKKSAVK